MGMAGDAHPPPGVTRVEELPMAALLAARHPTLARELVEDIPDLHVAMLARRGAKSMRPRRNALAPPTPKRKMKTGRYPGSARANGSAK